MNFLQFFYSLLETNLAKQNKWFEAQLYPFLNRQAVSIFDIIKLVTSI